jgi:N-acetylglucosamine-6-phosphate deacetylase
MTRVFTGATILTDGTLQPGDLVVDGGRIVGINVTPTRIETRSSVVEVIDCSGHVISPGFIDLQCNGAVGLDITTDPASIGMMAETLPRFGVTSFLPTVVTSPTARRRAAIEAVLDLRRRDSGADAIGLHFEGPMISRHYLGAHVAAHVTTLAVSEVDEWVASEAVSLVTLAPELPGALDAIRRLAGGGIVVSGGHTAMMPHDLAAARSAGLSSATHLFNAMAPFSHRAPGPVGAVLADDTLVAGIICDGIHVDPIAVHMAWNALGPTRMSLVSDASPALGMPYGRMQLAGFQAIHDETGVRTIDGVLAGSALALDQAVRNLIAFTGCDLADALATVTTTPADLLGLTDRGRLRVGSRADLTILDADANLVATIVAGTLAHGHLRSSRSTPPER